MFCDFDVFVDADCSSCIPLPLQGNPVKDFLRLVTNRIFWEGEAPAEPLGRCVRLLHRRVGRFNLPIAQ